MLILPSCGEEQRNNVHETDENENVVTAPTPEPNESYVSSLPAPLTVAKYDFSYDARLLVEAIEDAHPSFIMYGWPLDNYFAARDVFLSLAESDYLSVDDFTWAMRRYITSLRDAHMNLFPLDEKFIDAKMVYYNGSVYIVHDDGTQSEIITIGGISTARIIQNIDMYFYWENDIARLSAYSTFTGRKSLLLRSDADILDDSIQITLRDGNDVVYESYSFTSIVPYGWLSLDWANLHVNWDNGYVINYRMINDIFYIRASVFTCSSVQVEHIDSDYGVQSIWTLCWFHDHVHDSIADAVSSGRRNFIIDVRDNPGGNSMLAETLLEQMGMHGPAHGGYRRTSALTRAAHPDLTHIDYMVALPSIEPASNSNDILLVVLMNINTASSAMLFATWVQDGNLGYLIGEPSGQSPSAFGDMLNISLPQSGIDVPISHLRINRADVNADQLTLWPDIIVPSDEALDVALEFMHNRR